MAEDRKDVTVTFADGSGNSLSFVADKSIEIVCVCGKKAIAGDLSDGGAGVAHMEPRCAKFEDLEPDEFLAYLRRYYEKGNN